MTTVEGDFPTTETDAVAPDTEANAKDGTLAVPLAAEELKGNCGSGQEVEMTNDVKSLVAMGFEAGESDRGFGRWVSGMCHTAHSKSTNTTRLFTTLVPKFGKLEELTP